MAERLGIFGGTFDPVHNGHLAAAAEVRHALALDRVLLVVAGEPWQKGDGAVTSAPERLAMVEAAVRDVEGLEASAIEIERGGPTYTVDTLEALRADDRELFLILGADAFARLATWREPERVRKLATIVIVDREGSVSDDSDALLVPIPRLDIASTEIRARIAAGRPVDGLVPAAVVRMIAQQGLYTGTQW